MNIKRVLFYFILFIYISGCGDNSKNRPLSLSTISISPLSVTYEKSLDFDNLNQPIKEEFSGFGYIEYEYDYSGNLVIQRVEREGEL
jgi:hypothetical protein